MFRILNAARISAQGIARSSAAPARHMAPTSCSGLSTSASGLAKASSGSMGGNKSPRKPAEPKRQPSTAETIKQKVKDFVSKESGGPKGRSGDSAKQASKSASKSSSGSSKARSPKSGSGDRRSPRVKANQQAASSSVKMDKSGSRFTLDLGDGLVARIEFKQLARNKIELKRIEVPAKMRGKGIGQALARGALEEAARNKLRVKISDDYLIKNLDKFADARLKSLIDK